MKYKCCTFFGHHDCPTSIKRKLQDILIHLIEQEHVNLFYIGNHGIFDDMAYSVLLELTLQYPHIACCIVLAYLPQPTSQHLSPQYIFHTIYPEGIETVPKRFAISWRNHWMLEQSDFVVTYITNPWGGAAKFAAKAMQAGKIMTNIATDEL